MNLNMENMRIMIFILFVCMFIMIGSNICLWSKLPIVYNKRYGKIYNSDAEDIE